MNKCLECGKETKNKKFCSLSCSASFNNRGVRRNGNPPEVKKCLNCGNEFIFKKGSMGKFCSSRCDGYYKSSQHVDNWLSGNITWNDHPSRSIKEFLLKEQGSKCRICGMGNEWNGRLINFICDHIDGNSQNNKRENLRMICPNCDSQLDTYKGRNAGNGRRSRRVRYQEGKSY
jgi:hypothetical protein